jgi:hypothetical protein
LSFLRCFAAYGAIAVGAVLFSTQARAVYNIRELPDPTKRWAINLGLRQEYDDNVLTTEDNKQGSFLTVFDGEILANVPREQTFVGFRYGYNAAYYWDRPGGTKVDQSHSADVSFSHSFTPRLVLDVSDSFRRGIEPALVEKLPGPTNPSNITRRKGDFFYNLGDASVNYSLTRRWTVSLDANYQYWRYDDSTTSTNNDRDSFSSTASAVYGLTPRMFIGGNYQYSRNIYVFPGTNDFRNTESHFVYASFVRRFSPKLSLRINGGGQLQESGDGTQQYAPSGNATLTYNYLPDSTASGGFVYSLSVTDVGTFRSAETAALFGDINHRVSRNFRLQLTGNYNITTFSKPASTVPNGFGDQEEALRAALNAYYIFNNWLRGEIGYSYERVWSNISGLPFERNRGYLGLRATF